MEVNISIKQLPSGLYVGQSKEMPGLHLAERDYEKLKEAAPRLVKALLAEKGIHIVPKVNFET